MAYPYVLINGKLVISDEQTTPAVPNQPVSLPASTSDLADLQDYILQLFNLNDLLVFSQEEMD